jgi:hypothetical protein
LASLAIPERPAAKLRTVFAEVQPEGMRRRDHRVLMTKSKRVVKVDLPVVACCRTSRRSLEPLAAATGAVLAVPDAAAGAQLVAPCVSLGRRSLRVSAGRGVIGLVHTGPLGLAPKNAR